MKLRVRLTVELTKVIDVPIEEAEYRRIMDGPASEEQDKLLDTLSDLTPNFHEYFDEWDVRDETYDIVREEVN